MNERWFHFSYSPIGAYLGATTWVRTIGAYYLAIPMYLTADLKNIYCMQHDMKMGVKWEQFATVTWQ